MEPLQIAGIAAAMAKSAWSIGQALYVFSHDVSNIDRTITGLATEVKTLSGACALVEDRLNEIVADDLAEGRMTGPSLDRIWSYLQGLVQDTQNTIDQLDDATRSAREGGKRLPTKMWRQFKLDMNAKDIAEARDRIRSHTASLQVALQTLTIEVLYVQPQKADQQLHAQLSYLLEGMEHLKSLSAERTTTPIERQMKENEILAISRATASRGDSLYTASIGVGSLLGDYHTSGRAPRTNDWVMDLQEIDKVAYASIAMAPDLSTEASTDDNPSAIFDVGSRRPSTALTDYTDTGNGHGDTTDALEEADYDSDDEFSIEAARVALHEGRSSFHSEDYSEAASYLREALKMVRELPPRRQSICDTWELRYMLSVCTYHTQDSSSAKADLLSLVDFASRSAIRTDEQLGQACDASHLLTVTCVRLGDMEEAKAHSMNTLKRRHRLFGKDHCKSYQSLALMAKVIELSGNAARAKVYLQMIPTGQRNSLLEDTDKLRLEPANKYGNAPEVVQPRGAPLAPAVESAPEQELHVLAPIAPASPIAWEKDDKLDISAQSQPRDNGDVQPHLLEAQHSTSPLAQSLHQHSQQLYGTVDDVPPLSHDPSFIAELDATPMAPPRRLSPPIPNTPKPEISVTDDRLSLVDERRSSSSWVPPSHIPGALINADSRRNAPKQVPLIAITKDESEQVLSDPTVDFSWRSPNSAASEPELRSSFKANDTSGTRGASTSTINLRQYPTHSNLLNGIDVGLNGSIMKHRAADLEVKAARSSTDLRGIQIDDDLAQAIALSIAESHRSQSDTEISETADALVAKTRSLQQYMKELGLRLAQAERQDLSPPLFATVRMHAADRDIERDTAHIEMLSKRHDIKRVAEYGGRAALMRATRAFNAVIDELQQTESLASFLGVNHQVQSPLPPIPSLAPITLFAQSPIDRMRGKPPRPVVIELEVSFNSEDFAAVGFTLFDGLSSEHGQLCRSLVNAIKANPGLVGHGFFRSKGGGLRFSGSEDFVISEPPTILVTSTHVLLGQLKYGFDTARRMFSSEVNSLTIVQAALR